MTAAAWSPRLAVTAAVAAIAGSASETARPCRRCLDGCSTWRRRRPGSLPDPPCIYLNTNDASAYATAAIDREAREVASAPAGQRNHRLNRAAFKLGQLVGAGLLDEATASAALVAAGLVAGPGERKIRSTVQRGLRAGMRQPRRIVLT